MLVFMILEWFLLAITILAGVAVILSHTEFYQLEANKQQKTISVWRIFLYNLVLWVLVASHNNMNEKIAFLEHQLMQTENQK